MSKESSIPFLPSIKVHPFPIIHYYTIDGAWVPSNSNFTIHHRKALLECPVCKGLDDFYSCEKNAHYRAVHCPGNQEPEHEHQDILGGTHKHQVACAGITIPHFHVQCACCDSIFFLTIPEGN